MTDKPRKPSPLDPVRARVRRVQFVVALGLFAAVVGAIFSAALSMRVAPRMDALGTLMRILVATAVSRLWVLAALPVTCYAGARVVPLKPASTAIGAAIAGEIFFGAVEVASGGLPALAPDIWAALLRVGTFALGALLSMRAIRAGRAAAERAEASAKRAAEANRAEYAAFAAEAQKLAGRPEAPPPPEAPPAAGKAS